MVSFYPQDSALPVFRQNDYPQILHRGGMGRGQWGGQSARVSRRAPVGVSQHREPSASSQEPERCGTHDGLHRMFGTVSQFLPR